MPAKRKHKSIDNTSPIHEQSSTSNLHSEESMFGFRGLMVDSRWADVIKHRHTKQLEEFNDSELSSASSQELPTDPDHTN